MEALHLVVLLFIFVIESQAKGNLYRHLMNTRYNKRVRPGNSSNPVNITFGLSLYEIIDLEDKSQLLSLRITIRESWIDTSLSWEPTDFDGIKYIALHTNEIWIPDIVLYNNAGNGFGDGITRINAKIRHDGLVSLRIPSISQSFCKVHLESYPFDVQECRIKFGSWSFDESQLALNIESPKADLRSFVPSVEWKLIDMPGEFHSVVHECCPNPYHDIEYIVKIRRRSLFHAMYLIIPCVMISLLTLLVFLLPPECNERLTVGMAILVGLSFFFLLVAENMPATAEGVPLIGIYYTLTLIEISGAFFMTCVVLRFHHHNPVHGEVPGWIKVHLMGTVARFLGFSFASKKNVRQAVQPQMNQKSSEAPPLPTGSHEVTNGLTLNHRSSSSTHKAKEATQEAEKIIAVNLEKGEMLEKRQEEWRRAALVLNSIFMWLYLIAIILSFVVLVMPPLLFVL